MAERHITNQGPRWRVCALGALMGLANAAATAQVLPPPLPEDDPPPAYLDRATGTPWVKTTVEAYHGYYGVQRIFPIEPPCGASSEWCFDIVTQRTRRTDITETAGWSLTERASGSDAHTRMDTARALGSAKTELGANHAIVWSWGNVSFDFELTDADGKVVPHKSDTGLSAAGATASSVYNEPFRATGSGFANFEFLLERDAMSGCAPDSVVCELPAFSDPIKSMTRLAGDAEGDFFVYLFDLTAPPKAYCWGEIREEGGSPPQCVTGPVFVGTGKTGLPSSPGSQSFSFSAELTDGTDYALIVGLWMDTYNDSHLDMYNTASLNSIRVQPGMSLDFVSGSVYAVTAVPEPGMWLMLLAGLGGVRLRAHRQQN